MKKIGRYVIEAELGRGGFGRVYRAYDPVVGRPVAIKVLTVQDDDDQSIRFRNEAAASGRLVHKNIVTVHDFGQEDNHPYLVMELVEGQDLSHILKENIELDLSKKLDIIYQVTEGLQAAHRNGIVHRDVKPANIMILPNGLVKILDFGIARWTESAGTRLTRPGYLIGSIHYMSPEQFQGLEVDERSDIFSLGVVAYQLFTGKHPFWSENQAAVIYNVTQVDPPPLTEYLPDLPPELDRAILLALQKDRELRHPSVEDLRLDLQPLLFELKREEAEAMLAKAEENLSGQDPEAALTILRQVLRLDPSHPRARKLRRQAENLAAEERRTARTGRLAEEGHQLMAERRFDDASHKFREALALDPKNEQLDQLLKDCREKALSVRRARRVFEKAKRLLAEGEVANADSALEEALAGDPELTGAPQMREQVQELLLEEKRRLQREDMFAQAKADIENGRLEDARRAIGLLRGESYDKASLRALEVGLASKEAELQRRQALEAEKYQVRSSLGQGDFTGALAKVGDLRAANPQDAELAALLEQARQGLAEQRRGEAIADLKGSLGGLVGGERFDAALSQIDRVRGDHGEDAELGRLRDHVQEARAASERRAALRQARESAELDAAQARFDQALATLDECARTVGADPGLAGLRREVERRREAHLREAAVQEIVQRNRARIASENFGAAIAELESETSTRFGDHRLAELLEKAKAGRARQERIQHSREQASRAAALADQGDFAGAFALLEQARQRSHEAPVLEEAAAAIGSRRSQAVAAVAAKGRQSMSGGDVNAAVSELREGCERFPDEPVLRSLLEEAEHVQQERRRNEQADRAVARGRTLAADGKFDEALKLLERTRREVVDTPLLAAALDEIRGAQQAHERQRKLEAALDEGRTQFDRGELHEAAATVNNALERLGPDQRLGELRDEIQRAAEHERREKAVAEALRRAGELLDAGKVEQAVRDLQKRQEQLRDARVEEVLRSAEQRLAQENFAKALADCVAEADRLLAAHEPERALELLTAKGELAEAPEIQKRLKRARGEADAARRQREVHGALDKASALDAEGRRDEAIATLDEALKAYPGDEALLGKRAEVKASKERHERERAVEDALRAANALDAEGRLGDALDAIHRSLSRYPDEGRLLEVQTRLEAARERAQILQRARGLIAQSDFAGAIKLLEPAAKKASDSAELKEALAEARRLEAERERSAFVDDVVQRASALAEQNSFAEAVRLLDDGLEKEPNSAALKQARRQTAQRQEEHERDQLVRSLLQDAEESMGREAFEEALQNVESALELAPGDARLLEAKGRATSAIEERRRAEAQAEAVSAGRRLLSKENLDEACQRLHEANEAHPGSEELAQLLADAKGRRDARNRERAIERALSETGGLAKSERFAAALEKIRSAASEYPNDDRLEQRRRELLQAKEESDRRGRIADALETARKQASRSQFDPSLATIEQGLALDAGNDDLLALRTEVQGLRRSALLREAFTDLDQIERKLAAEKPRPRALRKLSDSAAAIAARLPEEAELEERCRDTRRRIDEAIEEAKNAPGLPFGKIAAGAGLAALLAVGAYFLRPGAGSGEVPLTLEITPAGAAVTLGEQTCVIPSCELTAPAGEHTVRIEKPGYSPVTTALTVPSDSSEPVRVAATLEALPSVLELVTDLENGRVFLDDRPAQPLEDGRWSLLDLPPGPHTLRVESGRTQARVQFESAAGAPPAVPEGATVQDAALLGISRLRGEGRAFATGAGGPALLDGEAIGSVGPAGLGLGRLEGGDSHTFTMGEGDGQRRVIFDVLNAPVLSLYLFSDRSVGSVVVRAGQPGVRVQIGGRTYETSRDGSVRALLDVGSYTIRAAKSGFRAADPKTVEIQKGIEQSVEFELLAVNPVLTVRGGEPGAQLVIDGAVKGVLDGSGDTTVAVEAGPHEIELRKEGFRPQRFSRSFQPGQTLALEGAEVQLAKIPPPPPPVQQTPPPETRRSAEEIQREAEQRAAEQRRQAQSDRFESARSSGDLETLRTIAAEAGNPFSPQATELLRGMSEEQGKAALASGSAQQLQAFLDRFPQSPIAGQVRQKLDELRQAQGAEQERDAIRRVVADYSRAYGAKNLAAMTQLHVGLTGNQRQALEQTFSFARALSMTFEITGDPQITGAGASAGALQVASLTDERGRERSTQTQVTITFEKRDGAWKIRSINPR